MKRIAGTPVAILIMVLLIFSQTIGAHNPKLFSGKKLDITDSKVDSTAWKRLKDMPEGRFAHSATVFDGKIYVFGGIETDFGPFTPSTAVYDPESDTWKSLAKIPTPRSLLSTNLVDGKIYAIGGFSDPTDRNGCATVEIYDPISDSWEKGTDMPLPRLESQSCVFNGKIYVFGGIDAGEKSLKRVEVYDPESDTWTALADMPTGRCAHSCFVRDSLIYVLGGKPGIGPFFDAAMNVVEIYNPRTDTWEEGVEMPGGKSSFSATLHDEMLYTFGGSREIPKNSLALFEIFDFTNNRWLSGPDIPTPRRGHSASLIGGNIYIIGGSNTPPNWPGLTEVEVFTIEDRSLTIPDTSFLHALIDEGVDENGDSVISYAEAEAVLSLDVSESGISELKGIEAFVNLNIFNCSNNQVDLLDVSNCSSLQVLHCSGNLLSSLDISGNKKIGTYDFKPEIGGDTVPDLCLKQMPSLHEVCVWESFVPTYEEGGWRRGTDTVNVFTEGSPNIYFKIVCGSINIEPDYQTGLIIYPNPTTSIINIESIYQGHCSFDIISLNGQHILSGKMEEGSCQIDLSPLQKGVYLISIRSKELVRISKIIKL